MKEGLSLYRKVLREVSKSTKTSNFKNFVSQQWRSKPEAGLREGSELLSLLKGLDEHKELMIRYNIGGFVDEREKIRRTGNKVGLQVPKFWDEGEDTVNKEKK